MMYQVKTHRLVWDEGTVLSVDDLAGCNIEAWLLGGHLAPVTPTPEATPTRSRRTPVDPEPDDTAEQPEEQE